MTLRLLLAGLAVTLFAPVAFAQGTTPNATLTQQASLFKQSKWKALYATYTPRFRRACPYSTFVTGQRRARSLLGTNFQLRGIRVRMETRTRAVVAYRFVRNGQTIANVTFGDRDLYVKIGPRWYDQLDRASSC